MSGGSNRISGFTLGVQNLDHPEMIVVGTPPLPHLITWPLFLGVTSQNLLARVRGLTRNVYAFPGESKKQSPPASGIGSMAEPVIRRNNYKRQVAQNRLL